MQSSWITKSIQDLIDEKIIILHKDGNHGSKYPRVSEFGSKGVPFLTAKLLDSNGNIDFNNAPRLSNEKAEKFTFGFIETNDVLLSHNATVGRVAVVPEIIEKVLIGTSLTHFRLDNNKLIPKYLSSFFTSTNFKNQLASVMSQTTRNQVPITTQRKLNIIVPPLNTQKKIANILSTLDDKIELNRKMNQTLEEMAQTLFKSWFVDFDPVNALQNRDGEDLETIASNLGISKEVLELFPSEFEESELGMIPKGWEVKELKQLGKVITGKTPSQKIDNAYSNEGKPFITPTDIDESQFVTITNRYLSEEGQNAVKNSSISAGAICVTCIGSQMGKTTIAPVDSFTNQQINSIIVYNESLRDYLFFNLRNRKKEIFLMGSGGSTMPLLNKSSFEKILVIVPCDNILLNFNKIIKENLSLILKNDLQNINLQKTRDTLLPKLLSGEVVV